MLRDCKHRNASVYPPIPPLCMDRWFTICVSPVSLRLTRAHTHRCTDTRTQTDTHHSHTHCDAAHALTHARTHTHGHVDTRTQAHTQTRREIHTGERRIIIVILFVVVFFLCMCVIFRSRNPLRCKVKNFKTNSRAGWRTHRDMLARAHTHTGVSTTIKYSASQSCHPQD